MSDNKTPAGEQPITPNGILKWQGVIVGIVAGAFVAGGTYFAARIDIASAREASEEARAKVAVLEQKVAAVDHLKSQQQETYKKLEEVLRGVQSMDRKLFALVCSKDPAKCEDYKPVIP